MKKNMSWDEYDTLIEEMRIAKKHIDATGDIMLAWHEKGLITSEDFSSLNAVVLLLCDLLIDAEPQEKRHGLEALFR